jgi:hypothetical protein
MDILYEAYAEALLKNLTGNETSQDEISARIDLGTLTNVASFIFSNLDAVTALGIVSALEARTQYDPRFRSSFPSFVRRNSWLL